MTDKSRILEFPDRAAVETEAAAWVARFDAGEVSAKDQAAFQDWLHRSALHREAIAEYGKLWSEFDALRLLTDADTAVAGGRDNNPGILERSRPWLAACAATAIVVAAGAVLLHPKPQNSAKVQNPQPARLLSSSARLIYETAVGSQRRIALADGSSVILNTNSRLEVDFSSKCRDVRLMRGEAYFDVMHDNTRPFMVHANNYVVRDIGTAFDVHLSKTGLVEVGVTKGSVEVRSGGHVAGGAKSLRVVAAGQDIVLGRKVERAEIVSRADMGRKLAWRQGELVYTEQPLGQVLADIGRYSYKRIEL